ncbi:unnamed protein product (mitochondrion) [Plasmodiophora brassicae]|uniref:K Homology domain-containing protein n=1 Tax=Plasmodiophora brassicae TaxID=37360 RepID=A0A0G4IWS0_PLABS|nr:hypothetical protein PBRA_007327 [Plasmodiophora brassicae]SPQ95909.1 unnamed protein product [Plasmodiophora brassicae]
MASVVLQVPRRAQSLIIGKGRKTITEIMQDTGTEIYVPARKQQSSEITIKGPTGQAVKDAQERIEHILGYELDEEELTVAYFGVPKSEHSALIGVNGTLLKDLRKQCGCHIHVPRMRDRERNVEVHGNPASIQLAQSKVEAIVGHAITISYSGPVVEGNAKAGAADGSPGAGSPHDDGGAGNAPAAAASGNGRGRARPVSKGSVDPATGKRRLEKGRINDIVFLPQKAATESDPFARILGYMAEASSSVSLCVSVLDNQALAVLLQNLLSQNIPVSIIVSSSVPGSNLSEARTLQSLGAQVKVDPAGVTDCLNFAVIDNALVISGSSTWTKADSLQARQSIVVTNHRDFVRAFKNEFAEIFTSLNSL